MERSKMEGMDDQSQLLPSHATQKQATSAPPVIAECASIEGDGNACASRAGSHDEMAPGFMEGEASIEAKEEALTAMDVEATCMKDETMDNALPSNNTLVEDKAEPEDATFRKSPTIDLEKEPASPLHDDDDCIAIEEKALQSEDTTDGDLTLTPHVCSPLSKCASTQCEEQYFDLGEDKVVTANALSVCDVGVQCSLLLEPNLHQQTEVQLEADNNVSLVDRELTNTLISELKKTLRAWRRVQKLNSTHNDPDTASLSHTCLELPGLQANVIHLSEQVAGLREAIDQLAKSITEVNFKRTDLKAAKGPSIILPNTFETALQDNTDASKPLSMGEQRINYQSLPTAMEQRELSNDGTFTQAADQPSKDQSLPTTTERRRLFNDGTFTSAVSAMKDGYKKDHSFSCMESGGDYTSINRKMRQEFPLGEHQNHRKRKHKDGKMEEKQVDDDVARKINKFANRKSRKKLPVLKKLGRRNFIVGRA